jgi:hypothetical protein
LLNSNVPDPNVQFVGSQWAWSSDGRYVIPNLATDAYLNVPRVTFNPGAVMEQGFYQPPFVAAPNIAASAAVRDIVKARAGIYLAQDSRQAPRVVRVRAGWGHREVDGSRQRIGAASRHGDL